MGTSCATLPNLRTPTPNPQPLTSKKSDAVVRTKLSVTYARLPLHFEPNQGQTDEQVNFLARGKGYALFLTSTEAVLALRKPAENSLAPVSGSLSSPLPRRGRTLPYHLLPPGKEDREERVKLGGRSKERKRGEQ